MSLYKHAHGHHKHTLGAWKWDLQLQSHNNFTNFTCLQYKSIGVHMDDLWNACIKIKMTLANFFLVFPCLVLPVVLTHWLPWLHTPHLSPATWDLETWHLPWPGRGSSSLCWQILVSVNLKSTEHCQYKCNLFHALFKGFANWLCQIVTKYSGFYHFISSVCETALHRQCIPRPADSNTKEYLKQGKNLILLLSREARLHRKFFWM